MPETDDTVGEGLSERLSFLLSDSKFGIFDIYISPHGIGGIISEPISEVSTIGSLVPITVALPNGDVVNGTIEVRSERQLEDTCSD